MGFFYNGQYVPDARDLEDRRDNTIQYAQHNKRFADVVVRSLLELAEQGNKHAEKDKKNNE